jgi:hypothetical protein
MIDESHPDGRSFAALEHEIGRGVRRSLFALSGSAMFQHRHRPDERASGDQVRAEDLHSIGWTLV